MKSMISSVAICLVLGTGTALTLAQEVDLQDAQPGIEVSTSVTARATVQDIDYQNRTVTLKGQRGRTFTAKVGKAARNFNQLHKGDQVTFRREEDLALALQPSNEPSTTGEAQTLLRAPTGQKPSGAVVNTTQVTATVQNIDRQKREVTVRLPDGKTRTLNLGNGIEALDRLQPGDEVTATLTESFLVDVAEPNQ